MAEVASICEISVALAACLEGWQVKHVEDVEEISAEFEVRSFAKARLFRHAQIERPIFRSPERVAADAGRPANNCGHTMGWEVAAIFDDAECRAPAVWEESVDKILIRGIGDYAAEVLRGKVVPFAVAVSVVRRARPRGQRNNSLAVASKEILNVNRRYR